MKGIVVQDQVRLGGRKILKICLNGIYFRLFRSMITLTIIALAVAFMANTLMGGLISASVQRSVQRSADEIRTFARWTARLSPELTWDQLSVELEAGGSGSSASQMIAVWGGLNEEQVQSLYELSEAQKPYLRFFAGLNPGKRYILIKGKKGPDALAWLEDEASLEVFLDRMSQQRSLRLPGGPEGLRELLEKRGERAPLWQQVMEGRKKALAEIRQRWGDLSPRELLAHSPDNLEEVLQELGFRWSEDELGAVVQRARQEEAISAVTRVIRNVALRRDLSDRLGLPVTMVDLDAVARLCSSGGGRQFFFSRLRERGIELETDRDQALESLRGHAARRRILDIAAQAEAVGSSVLGFSKRVLWLIAVACIVCVVGIANAMLMSVMERFREIATMKCLGATDRFVLTLFILESCIQGLAGGILGAVLAVALSLPLATVRYGGLAWEALPVRELLVAGFVGVASGVILAALASIYPAWFASRLAPMEAMRVE